MVKNFIVAIILFIAEEFPTYSNKTEVLKF